MSRDQVGIERRDLQPCRLCGRGLAHAGTPLFYRVTIERFAFDGRKVQQRHGLEEHFGGGTAGAMLAEVMGPGGNLAVRLGDASPALVCDPCSLALEQTIGELAERLSKGLGAREAAARDGGA